MLVMLQMLLLGNEIKKKKQIYNLGSSRPISINKLIEQLNYKKESKYQLENEPFITFEIQTKLEKNSIGSQK